MAKRQPNRRPVDLNCADCGRPLTEVLEAIVATDTGRVMAMKVYPDGTFRFVCRACDPDVPSEGLER
jgi:hypothetical protein